MKKLISLILALAMVLSLSVAAFAASTVDPESKVVTGTYVGDSTTTVYSVEIEWTDLSFTYSAGSKGTWDPDSHQYSDPVAAGWGGKTATITVTNHSNTQIVATPAYVAVTGYEDAKMAFDTTALSVATADNGTNGGAGTAVVGTITVTPGGTLPEGTNNTKIGTITISIA